MAHCYAPVNDPHVWCVHWLAGITSRNCGYKKALSYGLPVYSITVGCIQYITLYGAHLQGDLGNGTACVGICRSFEGMKSLYTGPDMQARKRFHLNHARERTQT